MAYDAPPGVLKLAECTAGCATAAPTWVFTTLVSESVWSPSLRLKGDHAVVTYYGFDEGALKLAVMQLASAPPVPTRTAVEYFHASFGHYFITDEQGEIAALDAGQFIGWDRSGQVFKVFPLASAFASDVCRFFSGTTFAPKSSHFYTPFAGECDTVKGNPDWRFERKAFAMKLPDGDVNCPAGTVALYRLYNDGHGGAPNHRYTTSLTIRSQMLGEGWISEGSGALGVIGCVPT